MATPSSSSFEHSYPVLRRVAYAALALALGITIAGLWNYHVVDAFGRDVFAEPIVGDTSTLGNEFSLRGPAFGVLFAVAAGLAATFTACNCVVFAMMPGLACSTEDPLDRGALYRLLGIFTAGVVAVGAAYGFFVGMLGPEGIAVLNERAVRLAQARAIFSLIGLALVTWGAAEMGFLDPLLSRLSPETRTVLGRPSTKAGAMGLLVGAFAVGRPFPVFRDFLSYAATSGNPFYGAGVMVVHGIGMILVMVLALVVLVWALRGPMTRWVRARPHGPRVISGIALLAGGAYFVFYWGLAFAFGLGGWGFKLGWYG